MVYFTSTKSMKTPLQLLSSVGYWPPDTETPQCNNRGPDNAKVLCIMRQNEGHRGKEEVRMADTGEYSNETSFAT